MFVFFYFRILSHVMPFMLFSICKELIVWGISYFNFFVPHLDAIEMRIAQKAKK